MKKKEKRPEMDLNCKLRLLAVQDTVDILGGKWKIRILNTLRLGSRHFMDLQRQVDGIGSKMLSSELKGLEINGLVKRTVYDTRPVTVEYELTPYGTTLKNLIEEMEKWGTQHRQRMFKPDQEKAV
jgi:DNA-binding HxlR family transcriptional regulator